MVRSRAIRGTCPRGPPNTGLGALEFADDGPRFRCSSANTIAGAGPSFGVSPEMHAWCLWERGEPWARAIAGMRSAVKTLARHALARTSRAQAAMASNARSAPCADVTRHVGPSCLLWARRHYRHVCALRMRGSEGTAYLGVPTPETWAARCALVRVNGIQRLAQRMAVITADPTASIYPRARETGLAQR
jgi:hypothetical protein